MKYKVFFILLIAYTKGFSQQKVESNNRIFVGYGSSYFHKGIRQMGSTEFEVYKSNFGFVGGYARGYEFREKSQFNIAAGFSYYKITYRYSDTINYRGNFKGNITYSNFFITPGYSYKATKWLNLYAGISATVLLNNSFQNNDIAKTIFWYDADNRNRMKRFYTSISLGIECKITSKISIKYTSQRSLFPVINLRLTDSQDNKLFFKQWQRTDVLTLQYQLNK